MKFPHPPFLPLGNNEDISFSRPADLDLIQSTPFKPLALKTPPRVLTLSERPLDFLDLERPPPTPQNEEVSSYHPLYLKEYRIKLKKS